MHRVEKAFGFQLLFQRFKSGAQATLAGGLHAFGNHLEFAAGLKQAHTSEYLHLLTVFRPEAQAGSVAAEQGAAHLRAVVLEREIQVARSRPRKVGDLTFQPQARETCLDVQPHFTVECGGCVDMARHPADDSASYTSLQE